ncbi:hypothetical protein [Kyrpidia tusciae]|uniref:Uncharacterized protein n=1 Tax=Kyrpidia tusciae (strain DSM 2912 / NBRC 15312 / T2) TaxID=562970 RepID=D5WRU8_KYRT2|nr:hypothetical protein [Kyrpidia tusciae]ADG06900.1 hypothetical protein Btus_2223 [Kyrpidia tusciae DSM 2912]
MSSHGFRDLIRETGEAVRSSIRVSDMIAQIVTVNGRIRLDDGLRSLTDLQLEFYEAFRKEGYTSPLMDWADCRLGMRTFGLGMRAYGRILWFDAGPEGMTPVGPPPGENDVIFGYVLVPEYICEDVRFAYLRKRAVQAKWYESAMCCMQERTPRELVDMLRFCSFAIYHMAPVLFYTEEETYTNFYRHNNLISDDGEGNSRGYLFDHLAEKPLSEWTDNQIWFVYSLYFLLRSGPPARGEEFNGCQLTPPRLRDFFERKFRDYRLWTTSISDADAERFRKADIPAQAEMLRGWRESLAVDRLFYREINGLNLLKRETSMPRDAVSTDWGMFPDDLQRYFAAVYEINVTEYPNFYEVMRLLIRRFAEAGPKPKRYCADVLSPIEEIVYTIVRSAVWHSNSDIGMSRSIRDYTAFTRAVRENRIRDLCEFKHTDYFCCVVPSLAMVRGMKEHQPFLSGVLKAISTRMQYNSWHYLPGNFPFDAVPPGRHFYFPPEMPDTAEWSDQHHKGHILASVRYSIRSPYHVTLDGRKFLAFFDLRLMRQSGPPYHEADLVEAVRYTCYLHAVYQALLDEAAESGFAFRFEGFTKEWYDQYGGLTLRFEEDLYVV